MADVEQIDAGLEQQDCGTYFDPLAQHSAKSPSLYPLMGVNKPSLKPVTCTFGIMKEGNLSFVSQDFRWFEAPNFPGALYSHAEASVGLVYL